MSILKLKGNASGTGTVTLEAPNTNTDQTINIPDGAGSFVTANASGDVGIGLSSPATLLDVRDGDGSILTLGNSGTFAAGESSYLKFREASTQLAEIGWEADTNELRINNRVSLTSFYTANTERARIDSSGHLLVSKSSTDTATAGVSISSILGVRSTVDGNVPLLLNRNSNNGNLIDFRKDNTQFGIIGCAGSSSNIITIYNTSSGGCGLGMYSDATVRPVGNTGTDNDNGIDLGRSATRFNDAFITNGVTTGSDANEKQQIAVLTDAEIAAAKRISAGFKTFKWNDAVEAKGDNARTHTGVIAQEVQTALEAEGLDAGNYAFWMSNTWWETQTEVPAVAEELDEDGNVITEAQEAYTRTDTYDTLEEAPAGATERTRLGIRYPELLAFIGAATEQRLTSIEARLDALEAV
jgi:hypothetical protein